MFYQTNHSTELSMGFTDKIRRDIMHINNTSRISTWTATETSSSGRFWPVVVVFHETHVFLLHHPRLRSQGHSCICRNRVEERAFITDYTNHSKGWSLAVKEGWQETKWDKPFIECYMFNSLKPHPNAYIWLKYPFYIYSTGVWVV